MIDRAVSRNCRRDLLFVYILYCQVATERTGGRTVFTVRLRTHTRGLAIDVCTSVSQMRAWIVLKRDNRL